MRRVSSAGWMTRSSSTTWDRRRCAPMISKNTATTATCRTTTAATAASARTTATTTGRNRAVTSLLATTTAAAAVAAASFHDSNNNNSKWRNQTTQCLGEEDEEQEKEDALDDHIINTNANTNGNRNDMEDSNDDDDDSDDSWRIPEHCLEYDHYNGVTIHVQEGWMKPPTSTSTSTSTSSRSTDNEKVPDQTLLLDQKHTTTQSMERILRHQIHHWRTQGIRGVWLHVPHQYASVIPVACRCGFEFHQVVVDNHNNDDDSSNNVLVLSQWLPPETPSRLPSGPTHQVGVGCLVWHPCDNNKGNALGHERRLLVVQERTGPAAAWSLWKMPTGLLDPAEDVHEAAVRELHEETGLTARVDGILAVRQAHATPPPPTATSSKVVGRKHSDLFFVCQLSLIRPDTENSDGTTVAALPGDPSSVSYWDQEPWTVCPTEIAAIRWMTVREYAAQSRWQSSPVYLELNQAILDAATAADGDSDDEDNNNNNISNGLLWKNYTLPLRFGWEGVTNALYKKGNRVAATRTRTTTM